MASKHTISVQVLAETKKAATALSNFAQTSGLSKLGGVAQKAGIAIGAGLAAGGVAAGAYIADGIANAGNLEQSIGAVDTVFKDNAKQMHTWASSADKNLGLTQNSYNELATVLGTQLRNGGTAMDELGGKTNELMGLGADLSSMFGGTTADAVGALSSALKGERDPIERYGVSLKQSSIDAKAAEMGFTKVGGSLSTEANQAATLALIMEQTSDAHGNFAKEADTVQGKQQRLAAQWENLSTRIGTAFLPALASIGDWVANKVMPKLETFGTFLVERVGPALEQVGAWLSSTVIPALSDFANTKAIPAVKQFAGFVTDSLVPGLKAMAGWLFDARGVLIPLAASIGAVVVAIRTWRAITAAWTLATQLAAAAQKIFNAVTRANPIGIIITLIVALVAGVIALYKSNDKARAVMDAAWAAIKGAIGAVVGWVTGSVVPWFQDAWAKVTGFVGVLVDAHKTVFAAIRKTISAFVGRLRDFVTSIVKAHKDMAARVVSAATKFVQWWKELPGKIVSWAGSIASKASSIAGNAGRALGSRIGDAASRFATWFRDLPGKIVSWAGSMYSKGTSIAGDVGRGLIDGIANFATRIRDKFSSVISGAIDAAKSLLGIASPSKVFRVIGQQTGEGLSLGLDAMSKQVASAAGDLAATVVTNGTPDTLDLTARSSTASAAARAAGTVINLTVQTLIPTADTGRQIAAQLRPYLRAGGVLG